MLDNKSDAQLLHNQDTQAPTDLGITRSKVLPSSVLAAQQIAASQIYSVAGPHGGRQSAKKV